MDPATSLRPSDIFSHLGRDYVIEGVLTYKLGGRVYPLARAVDGDVVLWIEPLMDALDDRLLVFNEVKDLDIGTPPPEMIAYRKSTFIPRWSGRAMVEIAGIVAGRTPGPCDVWRYRAAGDLYLQIEARTPGAIVLYGESVHKGMVDILPGR